MDSDKFKLLYRGSQDGFGAADFHTKCNYLANTVTIIESTTGYILGGYSQASWTAQQFEYCTDPKAFLFSLVNKFKKQFLCKITNPKYAIYSSPYQGPTFGVNDLRICENSNNSKESFAGFKYYQKPNNLDSPDGFYFCDTNNFLVREIEVFQIQTI